MDRGSLFASRNATNRSVGGGAYETEEEAEAPAARWHVSALPPVAPPLRVAHLARVGLSPALRRPGALLRPFRRKQTSRRLSAEGRLGIPALRGVRRTPQPT